MFYVEALLEPGAEIAMPDDYAERAAYVVSGTVEYGGATIGPGGMAVAHGGAAAAVRALDAARLMLIGGAPLDGERHIWWNFVSSSPERIERAKQEWRERAFPRIPGDDVEFIPLPE
jgi:redox-sensitive bicupin YhaK (pirin superfamily)